MEAEKPKIKYCYWSGPNLYFSVRKPEGGKTLVPLPHPDAPAFAQAYGKLKADHEATKKSRKEEHHRTTNYISNSWKALVHEMEKSRGYKELAPSTRTEADRYYRMFIAERGDKLVAELTAAELDRRLDEPDLRDFPGKAFNYLKFLKELIDLGIRRGYRPDKFNPARGADVPELGERLPWPDDVYEQVLDRASDMLRYAVLLGVYTGQRISDCIRIERDVLLEAFDSNEPMPLVQVKTGVEVYIPIHPQLAEIVRAIPPSPDPETRTVLYNRYGRPFPKPDQIQDRLKKLMLELGYFDVVVKSGEEHRETRYKFHGLRKLSSCHLVEAGATPHEVGAINGMDVNTVIHYTRGVAKRKLSRGFQERMNTIRPGRERPDLRLVG